MTTAVTRPPVAHASPAEICAALIPEEQPRFDREYCQALEVAAETFSLDELDKTLASWRRIAWMCTDSDRYQRMWRRAAELYTREEVPPEEALPITKARLGN
ncbi:MAG: DUF6247 family protein [Pseudonocardiaceae bacterium]